MADAKTTMTVSDALRRIGSLKGIIGKQRKRAASSVSWVDEAKPAFEMKACMVKADEARAELVGLQTAVQLANGSATVQWNDRTMSVAEAVRWREEYRSEINWLRELDVLSQDSVKKDEFAYDDEAKRVRVSKTHTCVMPEAKREGAVDEAQDRHDRINDIIEKSNRKVEIEITQGG